MCRVPAQCTARCLAEVTAAAAGGSVQCRLHMLPTTARQSPATRLHRTTLFLTRLLPKQLGSMLHLCCKAALGLTVKLVYALWHTIVAQSKLGRAERAEASWSNLELSIVQFTPLQRPLSKRAVLCYACERQGNIILCRHILHSP